MSRPAKELLVGAGPSNARGCTSPAALCLRCGELFHIALQSCRRQGHGEPATAWPWRGIETCLEQQQHGQDIAMVQYCHKQPCCSGAVMWH
eukprot:6410016-Lingulodinium_polyedra.AAC.1